MVDFTEHKEEVLAIPGRRIPRKLPRFWPPRAFPCENVDTGQQEGIEDVGSGEQKQGVRKFEPVEDGAGPQKDQLDKEVPLVEDPAGHSNCPTSSEGALD